MKHIKLKTTSEISRAELYVWKPKSSGLKGILVFCPGLNGVGKGFVSKKNWQEFAKKELLGLCGLSFASKGEVNKSGKGYTYVERESGKMLLKALDREFRGKELPIFLYGYSAGARMTASFISWKPERILGWCASGVLNWPNLPDKNAKIPYGTVACGEYDSVCYWSSLNYFMNARDMGIECAWISLKKLGHSHSPILDQWVKLQLKNSTKKFKWYDLDSKKEVRDKNTFVERKFSVAIPDSKEITAFWKTNHHP